jgi:PAS domain S-box-containing protein
VESIFEWFGRNPELVFLVYGLAFAVMGVAVWVQPRKDSRHPLAAILWLYVAYALIHAPADFIDLWMAVHGRDETAYRIGQLLTYVSYAFLFGFGRRLLGLVGRTVPIWLLPLIFAGITAASLAADAPWTMANVLVGYLVRFPAGVMAAAGFWRYYFAHRETLDRHGSRRYFLAAAVATFLWALFCGCVRAKAGFPPASVLNVETFLAAAHVPVHLFRTLCAVVMTWALIGILRIFDREIVEQLTARREGLERQLTDSERRFGVLVEQSLVGIYTLEEDRFSYVNPQLAAMWGVESAEAMVGRSVLDQVLPEDRELVRENIRKRFAGEVASVQYSLRIRRPDDEVRTLEVRGSVSELAGKPCIIGTMLDVTDRLKAEEALRVSEERYAVAVRGSNDGIWDWDIRNGRLHFSDRCATMMGFEPGEVENHVEEWTSRIHPEDIDRVFAAVDDHTAGRNPHLEVEYRLRQKDGAYRWVLARGICMSDAEGNPYRIAGSLTDLTERKRLEEQLLHAQKMEAIGRLAGGVAHDFNNLLTAILGYCELLLDRVDARDPNRHAVEEINKAGERAASLTGQLLAFSRRQLLQPRVVNLNDVVRSMDTMLQRLIGEDIELETRTQPGIPSVRIDPGQLSQVLVNLAVNARDAMPGGGRLVIETSASGGNVEVRVSDTGVGMDEATRERIFEPFFTTKEKGKGTGLGLSTSYGIVCQSGGTITVESTVGSGTSFHILLPAVAEDAVDAREAPRADPVPVAGETLLVVEDEEAVRRLVRETLERAGYRVLVAADGVEGIEVANRFPGEIRLVLTDIVMPRMSGTEMADRLEAMLPGVKVVLMSGYTPESVAQQGAMGAGRGYIQKPFRPDALVRRIREAVSS